MRKYECNACEIRICTAEYQDGTGVPFKCTYITDRYCKPKWKEIERETATLPKLTAAVFDRTDCPEWAKLAAVDGCGRGFYYEAFPRLYKQDRFFLLSTVHGKTQRIPGKFDGSNWINSIVIRQEKSSLPDWFKVGELVAEYDLISNRWEYGNIYAINGRLATMENGRTFHFRELLPARLRPWTFDELPVLPAEIKGKHGKLKTFISMACENKVRLGGDISFVDNRDLMDEFLMIDGSPCGVLEHLEHGEWVK